MKMETIKITWSCARCKYKKKYWGWATGKPLREQDLAKIEKHILIHESNR